MDKSLNEIVIELLEGSKNNDTEAINLASRSFSKKYNEIFKNELSYIETSINFTYDLLRNDCVLFCEDWSLAGKDYLFGLEKDKNTHLKSLVDKLKNLESAYSILMAAKTQVFEKKYDDAKLSLFNFEKTYSLVFSNEESAVGGTLANHLEDTRIALTQVITHSTAINSVEYTNLKLKAIKRVKKHIVEIDNKIRLIDLSYIPKLESYLSI